MTEDCLAKNQLKVFGLSYVKPPVCCCGHHGKHRFIATGKRKLAENFEHQTFRCNVTDSIATAKFSLEFTLLLQIRLIVLRNVKNRLPIGASLDAKVNYATRNYIANS